MNDLFSSPMSLVSTIIAILLTLSIHEAAHAAAADRLGDATARLAGRLTLNPLAHLDPIGTVLLLVAHFGWGKPVPVNVANFRQPNRDEFLVALAGPAVNLATAVLLSLVVRTFIVKLSPALFGLLTLGIFYNLGLAIFNLIPIPPLDGSKVLRLILPPSAVEMIERYSLPMLVVLVIAIQLNVPMVNALIFGTTTRLFQLLTGLPLGI